MSQNAPFVNRSCLEAWKNFDGSMVWKLELTQRDAGALGASGCFAGPENLRPLPPEENPNA